MSLRYETIKKQPQIFQTLFGISVDVFESLMQKVHPAWQEHIKQSYKRPGRSHKYDLEDYVLMFLIYNRSYVTQRFLGRLFDINHSRICRIIQRLEPIIEPFFKVEEAKHIDEPQIEALLFSKTKKPYASKYTPPYFTSSFRSDYVTK